MKLGNVLALGLLSIGLVTVAISTGTRSAAQTANQTSAPVQNEIFKGKIVSVFLDDPLKGAGQIMKDAKLEKIGDRWMLLGTGVPTGQAGEWTAGLSVGLSWESVTTFYIFTKEQFDEKMSIPQAY